MTSTETTVTVDRYERNVIRRNLTLLEGAFCNLGRGVVYGERDSVLVPRALDGLRLLEDLGWEHDGERDEYVVTLPPDRLGAWLDWLSEDQVGCIQELRRTPQECLESARRQAEQADPSTVASLALEFEEDSKRAVDDSLELLHVARQVRQRLQTGTV